MPRIDHLKPLNYLESECQQMRQISDAYGGLRLRINRLRENGCPKCCAEASGGTEATVFDCAGGEGVEFD